jgi:tetratricopeptide (TPR) repeat protein
LLLIPLLSHATFDQRSEKFDEKFTDIFALQDTIAGQVTQALMLKLSGEEKKQLTKRQTVDPEAYQLYLRGRYFWNKRTAEGLKKGIEYFEQATEKDPSYALAYAGLADCYNLLSYYSVLPPKDSFPKAKAAALKALEFDSHLAEAHTSLALARMVFDRDWVGTESSYQRAIELSPNYATAHQWHAEYLAAMGRSEEAIQEIKRAQELDPLSLIINAAVGFVHYYARRYDQANEQLQKMQELDPNFWPAHWFLGWSYLAQRRYEEAIGEFEQAKALSGESTGMKIELAHAYAVSGRRGEAQKIVGELMERSKQSYVSPYGIATIYVGLGEKDQAFIWLQKAYQERTWDLVYLKVDPKLDSLRADPRLTDLLRQLGLTSQ